MDDGGGKMIFRLILLLFITQASYAHVIYGVSNIKKYHSGFKQKLYVQMGTFSSHHAAKKFQTNVWLKTKKYTVIKPHQGFYKVIAGPFKNAQALNRFANQWYQVSRLPIKTTHQKPLAKKHEPRMMSARVLPLESRIVPYFQSHKIEHAIQNKLTQRSMKPNPYIRASHTKDKNSNWFVNAQIGPQFTNTNATMTVDNGMGFTPPNNLDTYSTNGNDASALIGLNIGHRWENDNPWLSAYALGLQYQYLFTSNINGNVTQFSLPAFVNYNYTWGLDSHLLLANTKLNFLEYKRVSPYFNGGLGLAFNRSKTYTETALGDVNPRVSPAFQGSTTTSFAYIVGAGLDYAYAPNILLNVGYQFTSLGSAKSGQGQGTWSSQSLDLGQHQSNAVLFGVTYLFDSKISTLYSRHEK